MTAPTHPLCYKDGKSLHRTPSGTYVARSDIVEVGVEEEADWETVSARSCKS